MPYEEGIAGISACIRCLPESKGLAAPLSSSIETHKV